MEINPVYSAIKAVLCNDTHNIYSYQELKDFKKLWDFKEIITLLEKPIIIIWDNTPEQSGQKLIPLGQYLTPYDWAVVFSLYAAEKDQNPPDIFIVDLCSNDHPYKNANAVIFFRLFSESNKSIFSWIHIYNATNIISLIPDVKTLDHTASWNQEALEIVRNIWRDNLSAPSHAELRHAISNVIGPLVLMGNPDKNNAHLYALYLMMKTLGQISDEQGSQKEKDLWNDNGIQAKLKRLYDHLDCNTINLILIDDHIDDMGWGQVVCHWVGASYDGYDPTVQELQTIGNATVGTLQIIVKASSSPEWIPDRLQGGSKPYSLTFDSDDGTKSVDILLLDLRLFSGHKNEREIKFVETLIDLAEKPWANSVQGDNNLPGIEIKTITDIQIWLHNHDTNNNTSEETMAYYKALTLFPRLIALSDFSLPIILFSSTGRREILQALKPYGNIITVFEKPRFFTTPDENVASVTKDKFKQAISTALDMSIARKLCTLLPEPKKPISLPINSKSTKGSWTVELMFDEVGYKETGLTLGGFLCIVPPGKSLAKDIEPELLKMVHDEFKKQPAGTIKLKNILKEPNFKKDILSKIITLCQSKNIFMCFSMLTGLISEGLYSTWEGSDEFHDEGVADNLYRELLRCWFEAALYCFARYRIPSDKVRFVMRAPTRMASLKDMKSVGFQEEMFKKWGVGTVYVGENAQIWEGLRQLNKLGKSKTLPLWIKNYNEIKNIIWHRDNIDLIKTSHALNDAEENIRYINFDTVRPLVEEVMREYRGSSFEPVADRVRAYLLNSAKLQDIPIMHFFTDSMLYDLSDITIEPFKSGFYGRYCSYFQTLLVAHRLMMKGLIVEAISMAGWHIVQAKLKNRLCDQNDINTILSLELSNIKKSLSGSEFIRLSETLKSFEPPILKQKIIRQATVIQVDNIAYLITIKDNLNHSEKNCRYYPKASIGDIINYTIESLPTPGKKQAIPCLEGTLDSVLKDGNFVIKYGAIKINANKFIFPRIPVKGQKVLFQCVEDPNSNQKYLNKWCASFIFE